MNKKAQGELIMYVVEFIVVFVIIKALGPMLYEATKDIPLGFLFRIILPSPESTALDFLKVLIESFVITGGTAAIFSR